MQRVRLICKGPAFWVTGKSQNMQSSWWIKKESKPGWNTSQWAGAWACCGGMWYIKPPNMVTVCQLFV